jgi:hypothetical protein
METKMDTTAKLQPPAPADDLEKIPVEQALRKLIVKTDAGLINQYVSN